MRQTEEYKLNLLDGEDKLSPRPLNENMEKVEAALEQKDLNLLKAVGAGGHNARIAFGTYVGSGGYGSNATAITVDFYPVLVQVVPTGLGHTAGMKAPALFVRGADKANGNLIDATDQDVLYLTWNDRGVSWSTYDGADRQLNASGATYCWVAIGYDNNDYGGEA